MLLKLFELRLGLFICSWARLDRGEGKPNAPRIIPGIIAPILHFTRT